MYIRCYRWFFLSLLFALLDMSTKYWIKTHVSFGEILYIFPGINFYYVNNPGLAFGFFFYDNIYYQQIITGVIVCIITIFLISLFKSVSYGLMYDSLCYSIIVGGAIGNLYDRLLYGAVVDFIDLYIKSWHWPTFNVADIEICIGLILLIIRRRILFFNKKKKN